MKEVIKIATMQINDKSLMDEWKIMSDFISAELKGADGFISRDSAVGEDGTVYCILKWESQEQHDAFQKTMETDDFQKKMDSFAKIIDVKTMKREMLKVI